MEAYSHPCSWEILCGMYTQRDTHTYTHTETHNHLRSIPTRSCADMDPTAAVLRSPARPRLRDLVSTWSREAAARRWPGLPGSLRLTSSTLPWVWPGSRTHIIMARKRLTCPLPWQFLPFSSYAAAHGHMQVRKLRPDRESDFPEATWWGFL